MNSSQKPFPGINIKSVTQLQFDHSFSYPVYFIRDLFNPDNTFLLDAGIFKNQTNPSKTMVCIDGGLVTESPGILKQINQWFEHHDSFVTLVNEPVVFPGGESVKNSWEHVHRATQQMDENGMDRHATIIAVGGGALLDMVGFAASIFHRGIGLIRVPTTTLAQNDAGIGVKNGINQYGKKNCIGTFSLPLAVINDFCFLKTLPFDHFIGGVAEAFKIALIKDAEFFEFLEDNVKLLKQRDSHAMEQTIKICAQHHLDHIANSGDPFETGSSRPLDYGHWSAHKIEMLSGFSMGHGQAVSTGIALDSYYAWQCGWLSKIEFDRVISGLMQCGLPVFSPYLETRDTNGRLEIEKGLEEFRQHLGGRLTLTMPDGIGKKQDIHNLEFKKIEKGISFLKEAESGDS